MLYHFGNTKSCDCRTQEHVVDYQWNQNFFDWPILLITNTQTTMNNSQPEGDIGNAVTMEGDQNDRKWLCFKVLYHIHVSPSLHELSNVFWNVSLTKALHEAQIWLENVRKWSADHFSLLPALFHSTPQLNRTSWRKNKLNRARHLKNKQLSPPLQDL